MDSSVNDDVLCVVCESEVPVGDADQCADCGEWACAECQELVEGKLVCLYCAQDRGLSYENAIR